MAFLVIAAAPDLSPGDLERAAEVGHVDAGPGYGTLMDQAGFSAVTVDDVTPLYRDTLAAWFAAYEDETPALEQLLGAEDLAERQSRRARTLATVDAGVVRRYLVAGRRPG